MEDRYVLLYDGEEIDCGFSTDYLYNAIDLAVDNYEDGGYDTIEIYDREEKKVVWTTDEDY